MTPSGGSFGPSSGERAALSLVSLTKSYGETPAVDGIELELKPGEIVGLLGPNGSGKTTTMKIVVGILRPDRGRVMVFGTETPKDATAVKRQVGYVPETPQLYEFLTGLEYLDFVSQMHGIEPSVRRERVYQFLKAFELVGHENEMISGYSQGMKQKVAITAALIHKPKILVLDEALNGLDPRSARILKDLLRSLATEGVSILFSTHVLEIAQAICDRVAIMYYGRIVAQGTLAELRKKEGLAASTLEEVFLKVTGTGDLSEVVQALSR